MSNPQNITFTRELLHDYSLAALKNASELILEASILYKHGHFARAYFLSVAAIEETGKAFLTFSGQGRNLADSAVQSKLKRTMENHSQKINAAFQAWIIAAPDKQEILMPSIDYMLHLKHGREPSMYTDIEVDSSSVNVPSTIIQEKASFDCIRLARECISYTQTYITKEVPQKCSKAHDQLFSMKTTHLEKIMGTVDFYWFYIEEIEAGREDFASAVITYNDNYASCDILFKVTENNDTDSET